MKNKITVLTHCSNDINYIDTYVSRWKDADDIYILVDNCKDGTYQKLLEYNTVYPQFHVFYKAYTVFRFDLVRNDLLSFVKDREGTFIFASTDCWFIEDNWKELLLAFCNDVPGAIKVYSDDHENNFTQENWFIGIRKENALEKYGDFYRHPFFQEIVWLYRGNLDNLYTVNPGGGEGFRVVDCATETLDIDKDDNKVFPLHLFHARVKDDGNPRWPSSNLVDESLRHLVNLFKKNELTEAAFSSWKFLAKMWMEKFPGFTNPDKIYKLLYLILPKVCSPDIEKDFAKDKPFVDAFLEAAAKF